MNQSKLLLSIVTFLTLTTSSLIAQEPSFNIVSNQSGLVTYSSTGTTTNSGVFVLFGDGHFGRALNPVHKFGPNNSGYTSKAFYLNPYTQGPPLARIANTGAIPIGSASNVLYHMTTETKIETSWNATQAHDAYYVLLFKNTTSNVMNGCLNFYYKDEEIHINTSGILQKSDWVSNRVTIAGSYGIYDRRIKWNFYNLAPGEQRVVYIPFKSILPAESFINASSSLSTNCNHVPSSLPNHSLEVSNFPHDPNLKSVVGCIDRSDDRAQRLGFSVDFQNIGEGPANNVIIEDQLSSELDASTLTMLPAQYPYTYTVSSTNLLTITFTDINLPGIQQEGVNMDETKSSVSFQICTFTEPDCISNTAVITFDNQPAITTNTVYACDIKGNCSAAICPSTPPGSLRNKNIDNNFNDIIHLEAYPNPVNDVLQIRLSGETTQMQLINISGQVVKSYDIDIHTLEKSIDMSNWNSGIYILRVIGKNQNKTLKIIKN